MQHEHYPLAADATRTNFEFESVGPLGTIKKIIVFENLGDGFWNLAFGDLAENGSIDDRVVSNNGDLVRVISTVIWAALLFSEQHPHRWIQIRPVDKKRAMLYNAVFKRHFDQQFILAHESAAGFQRHFWLEENPNLQLHEFVARYIGGLPADVPANLIVEITKVIIAVWEKLAAGETVAVAG